MYKADRMPLTDRALGPHRKKSSASGSDSSVPGLRPRGQAHPPASKTRGLTARCKVASGNPLERLAELLLDWNILQEVGACSLPKSIDDVYEQPPPANLISLPDVYKSFGEYVAAWEPLMIADIRSGVVSKFFTLVADSPKGTAVCTASKSRKEEACVMSLDCTFSYDRAASSARPACDRQSVLPVVMDLVLISLNPLDICTSRGPSLSSTAITSSASSAVTSVPEQGPAKITPRSLDADKVKKAQQESILGIVVAVNNHGDGGRVFQVHVLSEAWAQLREKVKPGAVSVFDPAARGMRGQNASRLASSTQPNKVKSYKLHYTVLDSLRSNWREFQALHDLGLNVPLLQEILGSERHIEMATTPPYEPDLAGGALFRSHGGTGSSLADPIVLSSPALTTHGTLDARFSDLAPAKDSPRPPQKRGATGSTALAPGPRYHAPVLTQTALVESWKMRGCTEKFMRYLRLKFNPSQLHAISTAAEQQGFTLVQGPPGTGKTTTILGILNAIHIREYNQYYKMALDALLGQEGQRCRLQQYEHPWLALIARLTAAKPRILVVAPSNGAVDNIVLRVMEDGFVDGNGGKYFPNIVRVGSGTKSNRVKSVSLEDLTDKELSAANGDGDRLDVLEQLNAQVTKTIKDLAFLQTLLVNLRTAFAQCHPLPQDFELRVDAASGLPVWVDHLTRSTSSSPPAAETMLKRGPTGQYIAIEALPDYIVYSHRLTQLVAALDSVGGKRRKVSNMTEMGDRKGSFNMRETVERSVIDGAQILFTTLNSAGLPSLESTEFVVTVVDEAAQSTEPSVLIALRRGCRQCVMVGDQQQLAATVFSEDARAAQYDRSLFQRLVEIGHPYIMLDTQYRMHPSISAYPCRTFYDGKLKDGDNVKVLGYLPPFLVTEGSAEGPSSRAPSPAAASAFQPLMFFDLQHSQEVAGSSGSQSNPEEAVFCATLIGALQEAAHWAQCKSLGSIGVITFYQDQLSELRRTLRIDRLNANLSSKCAVQDLELNTIDAFQGKEKDIIIISAVRANAERKVGFLRDLRRINVGLTRARKALFVVGHAQTLSSNPTWRGLLDQAVANKALISVPRSSCDLFGYLASRLRAATPTTLEGQVTASQGNSGVSSSAPALPPPGRPLSRWSPVTIQQPPQLPPQALESGRVVVGSQAVGWVGGANGAASTVGIAAAQSAPLCKDRDYALVDKLTSATHALHKRKREDTTIEDGEEVEH